jgi:3-oxoacyl-[acyl-carrier protein] reductase
MTLTLINLPTRLESLLQVSLGGRAVSLDIGVFGLGPLESRRFLDLTSAEWDSQISVVRETCLQAGAVVREAMSAGRGARIVFLASTAAVRAIPGATLSGVSGAFMTTMGQVAGIELAVRDITFNTLVAGWLEENSPKSIIDAIPAGRWLKHSELAGIIDFLASPVASYITGSTLVVDGGFSVSKVSGGSPLLS